MYCNSTITYDQYYTTSKIGQRVNNNNFKMEDVNATPAFSDIDSSVSTPQSMNPQIQTADDQQHHQTNQQPAPPGFPQVPLHSPQPVTQANLQQLNQMHILQEQQQQQQLSHQQASVAANTAQIDQSQASQQRHDAIASTNQHSESGVDTSSIDEGFHQAVLELERKKMEQTKVKPPLEKDLPGDFQSALKNFGEPIKFGNTQNKFNTKSPSNESLQFRPIKMSEEKLKRLETKSCENLDQVGNDSEDLEKHPQNYDEARQKYGLAVAMKRRTNVPEPIQANQSLQEAGLETQKSPVDYKDARNRFGEAVKMKQVPGTPPNQELKANGSSEILMPSLRATPKPEPGTPPNQEPKSSEYAMPTLRATPKPDPGTQINQESKSYEYAMPTLRATPKPEVPPNIESKGSEIAMPTLRAIPKPEPGCQANIDSAGSEYAMPTLRTTPKPEPGFQTSQESKSSEIALPTLRATPKPGSLNVTEDGEVSDDPKVRTPVDFEDAAKRFGEPLKRAIPKFEPTNANAQVSKSEESTPFSKEILRPTGSAKTQTEIDDAQKQPGNQPLPKNYQQARKLFEATPEKVSEQSNNGNGQSSSKLDSAQPNAPANIYLPGYQHKLTWGDASGMKNPPKAYQNPNFDVNAAEQQNFSQINSTAEQQVFQPQTIDALREQTVSASSGGEITNQASEIPEAITNLSEAEKNELINAFLQKESEIQSMRNIQTSPVGSPYSALRGALGLKPKSAYQHQQQPEPSVQQYGIVQTNNQAHQGMTSISNNNRFRSKPEEVGKQSGMSKSAALRMFYSLPPPETDD
ncbi:nuclear receptor corepressor 2-like isoform X3 [Symsagittifera roscoffensis]|uniref:nuclear receptor corepressor 2-like isoform X3 n=1 Tax=Symsagittifera roscoffensis TaxID=84072 RepID=UPI00307C6C2E